MKNTHCKTCGKPLTDVTNGQKFCKECGEINRREYQKQYHRRWSKTKVGVRSTKSSLWRQQRKKHAVHVVEKFTMKQWNKKLDKTKGVCPGCGEFVGKTNLTLDHVYPTSKAQHGRVYTINDVQPLCRRCNSHKFNRIDFKWRARQ